MVPPPKNTFFSYPSYQVHIQDSISWVLSLILESSWCSKCMRMHFEFLFCCICKIFLTTLRNIYAILFALVYIFSRRRYSNIWLSLAVWSYLIDFKRLTANSRCLLKAEKLSFTVEYVVGNLVRKSMKCIFR